MRSTFPSDRYSAATLTATTVLPRPVGRMSRVLARRHCSTILVWYPLSSTVSKAMRGWFTNAIGRRVGRSLG